MEESEYALTSEVQDKHWIWLGRKRIIQDLIERHVDLSRKLQVADVGCGFGCNISFLKKYGHVTGLEPNESARRMIKEKWGDQVAVYDWRFPEKMNERFDLILMAEVLEHIPDDVEAVDWIYDHLTPGGYVLITVPAYRFLWTQMDDIVHHKRRYSRRSLRKLFEGKFKFVHFTFYNFFLFPAKLAFVLFDRVQRTLSPNRSKKSYNEIPPYPVNEGFKMISRFEAAFIRLGVTFPFGPSIIMLAQKK